MSTLKIEIGVPMPGRQKYPLEDIKIGQSFFVPNQTAKKISPPIYGWGHRNARKFTLRTVTESGVKGVRVWRVE
jgi:hypothetical protein